MTEEENKDNIQATAPGTVITPGGAPTSPAAPPIQPPESTPVPPETPPVPQAAATSEPPAPVQAKTQAQFQITPSDHDEPDAVTWTASEFVAHDKSSEWYTLLALGALAGAGLMYILTKDFISVAVVVVAALLFGVYGAHKPKQLQYRIDLHGITIGGKHYSYDQFGTFSVIPEGAFSSIVLMPLKRFAVPLTIYYAPEDEDKIAELLSAQLPYEQRRRDAVDSLMRKVRF